MIVGSLRFTASSWYAQTKKKKPSAILRLVCAWYLFFVEIEETLENTPQNVSVLFLNAASEIWKRKRRLKICHSCTMSPLTPINLHATVVCCWWWNAAAAVAIARYRVYHHKPFAARLCSFGVVMFKEHSKHALIFLFALHADSLCAAPLAVKRGFRIDSRSILLISNIILVGGRDTTEFPRFHSFFLHFFAY